MTSQIPQAYLKQISSVSVFRQQETKKRLTSPFQFQIRKLGVHIFSAYIFPESNGKGLGFRQNGTKKRTPLTATPLELDKLRKYQNNEQRNSK